MQIGTIVKLTDCFFNTSDDFLLHYPELSQDNSYRITAIRELQEMIGAIELVCVETSEKFNVNEVYHLPEGEQPKAKWWAFLSSSNPSEYEVINANTNKT
ncbi:hypothetical protein CPT_Minot_112 [Acinetobacter phage Minot]|nr:hypothetical protein CPT_Minot_112 [Acinetobacter phage Minot]QQO96563.1 hypothetical protein CPT_Mokit_112 [Acinetobacter phage Mokit]QQO96818.1 hypothetical protein CPT_Melin_117 [Acinetobacter phage Melin]